MSSHSLTYPHSCCRRSRKEKRPLSELFILESNFLQLKLSRFAVLRWSFLFAGGGKQSADPGCCMKVLSQEKILCVIFTSVWPGGSCYKCNITRDYFFFLVLYNCYPNCKCQGLCGGAWNSSWWSFPPPPPLPSSVSSYYCITQHCRGQQILAHVVGCVQGRLGKVEFLGLRPGW